MSTELAYFDKARLAIEKAATVDEVKAIRDKAEALREYARQSGQGLEMQNRCAEIKIRAERRAGELLAGMEKQDGGDAQRTRCHRATELLPAKLADLGITRTQSSRWQTVSKVPSANFEQYIAETVEQKKELTSIGVRKLASVITKAKRRELNRENATEACSISDLQDLALSGKKFSTIYADPPWPYDNQATRASTGNHYDTMSMDDIANLPVRDFSAENAQLHLWTTNGFIYEALELIASWGFEYKSCFIWVKPQMGIGNYWRVSHEFLLLGIRGKCPFLDNSQKSWLESRRGKHSSKPDKIREIIESVGPSPRIELFARQIFPGWTCWGNEIKRNLFTREL